MGGVISPPRGGGEARSNVDRTRIRVGQEELGAVIFGVRFATLVSGEVAVGVGLVPGEGGEGKGLYLGKRGRKRVYTLGRGGGKGFIPREEGEEKGLYLGNREMKRVYTWGIRGGRGLTLETVNIARLFSFTSD